MKGALALAIAVLTLAAGRAGGETLPRAGPIDPRIRTAAYSPDQVYRLYGFVGFHIDLEFEPGETFEALSGGDLEGLTYSAHANVLTLKPKVARTEMNLAVTTSKRRYYFEYSVSPRRPDPLSSDVMYAVRFNYPPTPASPDGLTDEERIALELAKGRDGRPRNSDYWFCGNAAVKPVGAFDDGVQTRITFARAGRAPGALRPERRRDRVAAQFQHRSGRCPHPPRGGALHRATGEAHGLHRQQGVRRERSGAQVRDRGARGDARAQGRAPVKPEPGDLRDSNAVHDTVVGERSIASVNAPSSLQTRISHILAMGLMSTLGLALLGWYYAHTWTHQAQARKVAENTSRNQAAGEMALPSLKIDPPSPVAAQILGPPPALPATSAEASATPGQTATLAPAAGSPQGLADQIAVAARARAATRGTGLHWTGHRPRIERTDGGVRRRSRCCQERSRARMLPPRRRSRRA